MVERMMKLMIIITVFVFCWIQVICQPTLGNEQNRKCSDISTTDKVLLNKLQDLEKEIDKIKNYGKIFFSFLCYFIDMS